jgi:hypothetical protein
MNPSERTICFRKGAKKCADFFNAGAKVRKKIEKRRLENGKILRKNPDST